MTHVYYIITVYVIELKRKNSYDFCLIKLLNLKVSEYNMFKQKTDPEAALNEFNNELAGYGLHTF